jgi:hypothetical protein
MSKSNISKHWAGKGYNLPSTPLKGAYSQGADSQIYVSNRDVFDRFQKDMVDIAKEQIEKSRPKLSLEERLDKGEISAEAYKILKAKQQPESKAIKEGDFSKAVQSVDNLIGTMPGYERIGKNSYETPGYKPFSGASLTDKNFKSPLGMIGDLNKDGKMSLYESKRQVAIEKNMKNR